MSDWVTRTLSAMTLDEKIALLAGRNRWETVPIDRLGIPALKVTDGPNGARGADENHGPSSTSFPVGAAMGATFDPELIEEVGRALAAETRAKGADVLLAPTVNIPRVPVAGRNFECFSEDPVLSGTLAAAYVHGLQDEGVGACIKHFVCNDQEFERTTINAEVDERTLHEIYLEPFRIAVERSRPWAAMSAYNTVNGVTASEHPLLDEVLRNEFGFDGAVISDWNGTYSPGVAASGLDLEMPGPARWMSAHHFREALDNGLVDETLIDTKARRLLTLLDRTGARHRAQPPPETGPELDHHRLAQRVATDSVTLLKNTSLLPLAAGGRIAMIGDLAQRTPHQGGGSSGVNAHHVVSILDGLQAGAPDGTLVTWNDGPSAHRYPPALPPGSVTHDGGKPGFLAEYFAGTDFGGEPVRVIPATRSFLIFNGTSDGYVDHEAFSLRISGRFRPAHTGRHTFGVSAGGNIKVTAAGDVVASLSGGAWEPTLWDMALTAGDEVELLVEYTPRPGDRLRWIGLGCRPPTSPDPIADAAQAAAAADVAVVVVGLTPEWESEGFDRTDLRLSGEQDRLVAAVAAAQPATVVVVAAGSAVEMPWLDEVGAVLHVWYGGQEIGHAVADVLFGREDPGGRLPVTFPRTSQQHPGLAHYPGEAGTVRYGEGVYVGYRGFDRLGLEPQFRFGHGLSYTTFDVSDLDVVPTTDGFAVTGTLVNTGDRDGVEVVQIFARDIGGVVRRLAGFGKYRLRAGAAISFEVVVRDEHLRWWNPERRDWEAADGAVQLEVTGTFGTKVTTAHV